MADTPTSTAPTVEQRHLVEEFGLLLEQQGGTRMAGRIAGWLLLCTPPVQSLTGIATALSVSKGAASEAARLLVQMGIVERLSEPGRRGDWYRSRPQALDHILYAEWAGAFRDLLDRSLRTVPVCDPPQANHVLLRDLRDFHAFLERELPALRERWERERDADPTRIASAARSRATAPPTEESA